MQNKRFKVNEVDNSFKDKNVSHNCFKKFKWIKNGKKKYQLVLKTSNQVESVLKFSIWKKII